LKELRLRLFMHLLLLVTALLASALTAQDSPPTAQAASGRPHHREPADA
jgi:hypothetical protein